jgi:hypothetical protein
MKHEARSPQENLTAKYHRQRMDDHTRETGHSLVVVNRGGDWEGFCFDCSLAYIFGSGPGATYEDRLQATSLVHKCSAAVRTDFNLHRVAQAVYLNAERSLNALQGSEVPTEVFSLINATENETDFSHNIIDLEDLAWISCTSALQRCSRTPLTALPYWSAAMWCRAATRHMQRLAMSPTFEGQYARSAMPADLWPQALTVYCRVAPSLHASRDKAQATALLKMEFTYMMVTLLQTAVLCSISRKPDESTRDITSLVGFITDEVTTESVAAALVAQPSIPVVPTVSEHKAHLFTLLAGLSQLPDYRTQIIQAVLQPSYTVTSTSRLELAPALALAALHLYGDLICSGRCAGLHCILTLLKAATAMAASRASKETESPQLQQLTQQLLADDCNYSSRLFGIWDKAQSSDNVSSQLHSVVAQTFEKLALGCLERFYHYSAFPAKVCTALLQRYVVLVRQLVQNRLHSAVPVLGGSVQDHGEVETKAVQYVLQQALVFGACGSAAKSAILAQCTTILGSAVTERESCAFLSAAEVSSSAAELCAVAHVLPLLQPMLQDNGNTTVGILLPAVQILAHSLAEQPAPAGSAQCDELYRAVLQCLQCLNAIKLPSHLATDVYQESTPLLACAALVSAACSLLSTDCRPGLTDNDELFTALIELLVPSAKQAYGVNLQSLYSTAYTCRSLHSALINYQLTRASRQVSTTNDQAMKSSVHAYAQFLVTCCQGYFCDAVCADLQKVVAALRTALYRRNCPAGSTPTGNANDGVTLTTLCSLLITICSNQQPDVNEQVCARGHSHTVLEAALGVLVLSLAPDPVALCGSVTNLVPQLLHAISTIGATPTAATAAVRFTYQLIITELHVLDATGTQAVLPRKVPPTHVQQLAVSQNIAVEVTAPVLCEYWLSCDSGLAQHMLQRLLQYAACLVTSKLNNDSSAHISGLTLQVVRELPCSALHGVVPTLSSVAAQLVASGVHMNEDSVLDTLLCSVLEASTKEGICSSWKSLQQPSASTVPGTQATIVAPDALSTLEQTLLVKHDSVLEILRNATAFTQARCPASSSTELNVQVHDATLLLLPIALAAFTQTTTSEAVAWSDTSGLSELEEVAEFAQRSGW